MRVSRFFATVMLCVGMTAGAASLAATPVEMRFVMAHKPDNQDNIALIKEFSHKVNERTQGAVVIQPVMPHEVLGQNEKINGSVDAFAVSKLYAGEAEMGQISVKAFKDYSDAIIVLDTPMIFTSHAHASKVLDGAVGKGLRESVYAGTNGRVRGLSFTYSGGFRNLYSNQKLDSLSDVKGLKMRIPGGMMSRDLMDRLGVDMTAQSQNDNEWVANLIRGDLQIDEAETIRFERYARATPELTNKVKTVLETNHNLFLTMVSINGRVYERLTPEQQRILEEEAQSLAIKERELSIRQEQEAKKAFEAKGIRFVQLSPEDRAQLQSASLKVQAMHAGMLGSWMQAIRAEDSKHYANKPDRISLNAAQ